jgi:hypothetical protein
MDAEASFQRTLRFLDARDAETGESGHLCPNPVDIMNCQALIAELRMKLSGAESIIGYLNNELSCKINEMHQMNLEIEKLKSKILNKKN